MLQANNGNLPPTPQTPTDLERQVVAEYKAEQMRIEQEQQASEAAATEALVDDSSSAAVLQAAVANLHHLHVNQFVLPMLPPAPVLPPAPAMPINLVREELPLVSPETLNYEEGRV